MDIDLRIVEEVAQAVRVTLVRWYNDETLEGFCGLGAVLVARALRRRGIMARPHAGRWRAHLHPSPTSCRCVECGAGSFPHCWTVLPNGTVVDVTATQFAHLHPRPIPEVLVAEPSSRSPWPSDLWPYSPCATLDQDEGWWSDEYPRSTQDAGAKRVERLLARKAVVC